MSTGTDQQERISREALEVLNSEFIVAISENIIDRDWDAFLESTPLGQFQQSSIWAMAKAKQGWNTARFIVWGNHSKIEGGLQLLWRKKRCVNIGYVSKGPVYSKDSGHLIEFTPNLIAIAVQRYGIHAIILQAPDFAPNVASLLSERPFEENRLVSVISASLMIDLTEGITGIRKRMTRNTRQESRQALERGVSIREGSEADLDAFFQLMLATCTRQGQKKANPETAGQLHDIWRAFHENNHIRLTLAICEGEIVSGLLSIMFGDRVSLLKKGWSGQFPERHPNELLYTESIEWAAAQGYRGCDFVGLDRKTAETLLSGKALSDAQKRSRDFFNLRFGGTPKLLPESRVYLKNPLLSLLYREVICRRSVH